MSSGKVEVKDIIKRVMAAKCDAECDARVIIDAYFNRVVWSALKDEWNVMTEVQRSAFAKHVFDNTRR